ncbi:hypothetical protein CRE_24932 [Caenorhabditis remanei]|uniref:Uncharacterized protein n=1 Tax=Caenorhabditis remanei TaxID=31234 RepID=E3MHS9_CAERE|nr:hypothetical protein CRE_24932 [Caenorhabditis remanei]
MFSLCSKRCNLVVKSFRHGFTGIQVALSQDYLCLNLSVKGSRNVSFVIDEEVEFYVHQNFNTGREDDLGGRR